MKYLKLFQNENEYLSYKDSSDYITPNVSMIFENRNIRYQKKIKQLAKVGDIAYWNGSSVKTTSLLNWNRSLGTPVGVVIIPENFLPDGKARIISLNNMVYNGSEDIMWDPNSSIHSENNTPLPDYYIVPTTDNAGSTSIGIGMDSNCLPSDRTDTDEWISGAQSYVDPLARYHPQTLEWGQSMIPSPYLGDEFNPVYGAIIKDGNALSDFNGLSNTQLLVNEGPQYEAAHACWNYKDPSNSNLQWYLPAMGELGFLMPRFQLINTSIQAVGGTPVEEDYFLSSSEYYNNVDMNFHENFVWVLQIDFGSPCIGYKDYVSKVRGFTCL